MMTIQELRAILGRPELTDDQLMQIRDSLYGFARVMIQGYLDQRRSQHPSERV